MTIWHSIIKTYPLGLEEVQPLPNVDYVYSPQGGYRGRVLLGHHSICRHQHKTPDAAVRCANRTQRRMIDSQGYVK